MQMKGEVSKWLIEPGRKPILKMLNIGIKTEHYIAPIFRKLIKILSLNPSVGLLKTYRVQIR